MNGERHKENLRGPFKPIVIRTLLALMGLTVLSNNFRVAATAPERGDPTTVPFSSQGSVCEPASLLQNKQDLREKNREIKETVPQLPPNGAYAVADMVQNRLWIKKGEEAVFEAVSSTGGGVSWSDEDVRDLFCKFPKGVR